MPYQIDVEYTNTNGTRTTTRPVTGSHEYHLADAKSPDHSVVTVQCDPEPTGKEPNLAIHFKLKEV